MDVNITNSWKECLEEEIKKPYFKSLIDFVNTEYHTQTCFPKYDDIFKAFEYCSLDNLKVVIIGQDPYHGIGQANGLCFSVNDGVPIPPSLGNIFKEIASDEGISMPLTGNLERWAKQGVLLLNATLTVRAHQAGSHQRKGWEKFTDAVIKSISKNKTAIVFLLWGGFAKKKGSKIDSNKHCVLTSGHPSPLSANRGYWFGNKHFSLANKHLVNTNQLPIKW